MRFSFKLVVVTAVLAFWGALLGVAAPQFSFERYTHLSSTVPSDQSQLKGDPEQQSLSPESFPALAEDAFHAEGSGAERKRLPEGSFSRYRVPLPFDLYQRPPPA